MSNLIVFPTGSERAAVESTIRFAPDRWKSETIGFGVVASGVNAYEAIKTHQPTRVVLAGIAGLFDAHQNERQRVGEAAWFDSVGIDGIGVGQGDAFVDALHLGWHWITDANPNGTLVCQQPPESTPAMLLTVCAASADDRDASRRSERYPDAVGEDMEAFAVAFACQRANVPLSVVRGFSNIVGQRDKSQWRIEKSLSSVASQLQRIIDEYAE